MQLLFFGSLKDIAGKTQFELSEIKSTDDLKREIFRLHPELKQHSMIIAVNKKVINGNIMLSADDVVAFMPPFSGG